MPLQSLLQLVDTLKQRIVEHGDALKQSEAQTRYALINPFLRELGWDTADPNMVIPEYKSGHGSADYALRQDGKTVMIVEAKKLGTSLADVVVQALGYCQIEGVNHLALTDGRIWDLFATHQEGDIDEKRIVKIDLAKDSSAEVCRKAFALWQPSAQEGRLIAAQSPVAIQPAPSTTLETTARYKPTPPGDWQPIASLNAGKGRKPPVQMLFPDGSRAKTAYWKSVLVESVRWLIDSGKLPPDRLPLRAGNKYIITEARVDPLGKPMSRPVALSSYFVETNYSAVACVRNTILAIRHAGHDPAEFKVRLS